MHILEDREVALSLCAAAEGIVGSATTPLQWLEGGYRDFIGAYRESDGPVPEQEIASLIRYMRLWIRRNVVKSLSVGTDELDPYIQQQFNAFRNLATAEWRLNR